MGGTGMAVVADIGRASEGNGAVLRPNILLNRHTHPAHPGSGRLVSSPSWAPACKLQGASTNLANEDVVFCKTTVVPRGRRGPPQSGSRRPAGESTSDSLVWSVLPKSDFGHST